MLRLRHRVVAAALGALGLAGAARAYETDQLTRRDEPLMDAREVANAEVNRQLVAAAQETNKALGCHASTEQLRRSLATHIHIALAQIRGVPGPGRVMRPGFGAYAAFLETADIDRRDFADRSDIYGALTASQSLVLGTVGVCSTIDLAGVLMGTDKADHFFGQGYDYLRLSRWGRRPDLAREWGTSTELGAYGLLTSNVFSFADLHANWLGYTFYRGLLTADSALQRGHDGCVELVHPFDWADWVDDGLDEVLNPSVYGTIVGEEVNDRLREELQDVCDGYRKWGDDVARRRADIQSVVRDDATPRAPVRPAGTDFGAMCGAHPPVVAGPWVEAVSSPTVPGTAPQSVGASAPDKVP